LTVARRVGVKEEPVSNCDAVKARNLKPVTGVADCYSQKPASRRRGLQ